jgi:hypothetical protein
MYDLGFGELVLVMGMSASMNTNRKDSLGAVIRK